MHINDPAFWRAGAISTVAVISVVLIMLTIDSLAAISPGGSNVPLYTVINQHIDYKFDATRGNDMPVIALPIRKAKPNTLRHPSVSIRTPPTKGKIMGPSV